MVVVEVPGITLLERNEEPPVLGYVQPPWLMNMNPKCLIPELVQLNGTSSPRYRSMVFPEVFLRMSIILDLNRYDLSEFVPNAA